MNNPQHTSKSKQAIRGALTFERLEPRWALDADGVILGTDVHLTLSFAADGTSIAGQSNQLATLFDAIAPREVWQEKILTAFQTWAVNTNADIGVVADGGQAFGTGGAHQGDARFGDIRIGAISMAPNVAAVSVPVDSVVSGTWFGDVLFNTAYHYQTIDDIFAIATHEAGNVFGLKDNADPNSPLHPGDPPQVRQPTATDIGLLQGLHGTRVPDLNEVSQVSGNTVPDNDSFANATELATGEIGQAGHGSAPTIVYGDITSPADNDFFYVAPPSNYGGALTIEVRTQGISLLAPHLRVYDQSHTLIAEEMGADVQGSRVTVALPSIVEDHTYYFQVTSSNDEALNVGSYSLTVVLDDVNQVTSAQIDAIAGGAYRNLPAEEIAKIFDPEEDFLNDDNHADDGILDATELPTAPGFLEDTRYELIGSIVDATDLDSYGIKTPGSATALDVMTIAVRSLDAGGLVPHVELLDENRNPVATTIVANGGGDYIIQAAGINPGKDYLVRVGAADPGGPFDTGNYKLTVSFSSNAVAFESLGLNPWPALGNGATQNIHTLYVGKQQLFHFVMEAENVAVTTPTVLVATILDAQGEPVYQISVRPGDIRSREAVLLAPGTYTVRVVVLTLDGSMAPEIAYNIRWTAISDPFVGDPNDPTANPFACTEPGMEGFFCYPGEIISPDPTLWDSFIGTQTDPPTDFGRNDTLSSLFSDWWSWVWNEFGTNGPVFANNDQYHTAAGAALVVGGSPLLSALSVGQNSGLLSNDLDPEGLSFLAVLSTPPLHGTLQLETDGSFTYTPDAGFQGLDQFSYSAFDFTNDSNVATVKLVVGDSGDFDADGAVSGRDFLAWQRGFGKPAAALADGDANMDEAVDGLDLTVWQQQYVDVINPPASNGDADGDGDVDGRDFLAWQRGFGITSGASPGDGDANGDQAVDSQDLGVWQSNYGNGAALATATAISVGEARAPLALLSEPAPADPVLSELSPTAMAHPFEPSILPPLALANRSSAFPAFSPPSAVRSNLLDETFLNKSSETVFERFTVAGGNAIETAGPTHLPTKAEATIGPSLEIAWEQCASEITADTAGTILSARLAWRQHRSTSRM